jgi:Uma2 family endonuclease
VQEIWDRLSEAEQARIIESLPSEPPYAVPPEGDPHRIPKARALEALDEFYRRTRRRIYLSSELPIYYPGEAMFAPDLIAALDVEPHARQRWVVSQENHGLDFALEIHLSGDARKDFEENVVRYARLGIPEYFAFDVARSRLVGYRLPQRQSRSYEPIVPQGGRWPSRVLELDLALEQGQLRFFHGSAPLLDARELIARLSTMVDDAIRRAEEEAQRAEQEAQRAEQEAQRAKQEAQRAERLAARLRTLGIDPDAED